MISHATLASPTAVSNHADITKQAYQLWLNAGEPHGRCEEFWLEAEHYLWHLDNEKRKATRTIEFSEFSELMHDAPSKRVKRPKK